MLKSQVKIDHIYQMKVSNRLVPVKIMRENPIKGWVGLNLITHREIHIKTAARLRREITP